MALFHVFSEVENRNTGVPMSGVQVRVRFAGVDTLAPIYMDEAGTPFTPPNYCVTDADGMYSFYVDSGEYDLDFLVGSQVIKTIPNYRPAEVGPTGPANSTYTTTNALENADVANVSGILSEVGKAGTFTIRNYVDFTAEVAADSGKVNYIRSISDPTKVWVRTSILSVGAAQTGAASGLTVDAELAAKATLTGVARTATNLGTFTGSTIPDNVAIKSALQAVETAVENTTGNAATKANATAIGVAATDNNMGTFTGSIIPDNQTAKQGMQAVETSLDGRGGTLPDYGGVGNGVADNATAINAALAASSDRIVKVSRATGQAGKYLSSTSFYGYLNSRFEGDGQLVLGGKGQARSRAFITNEVMNPDYSSLENYFDGDWSKQAETNFTFVGPSVGSTAISAYRLMDRASQKTSMFVNAGGTNTALGNQSGGRTGMFRENVRMIQGGQGDLMSRFTYLQAYSTKPGATHFLACPAVSLDGADFEGLSDGNYLQFYEVNFHDSGAAVAVGNVANYTRTNAGSALHQTWKHDNVQSVGTQPIDGLYQLSGPAKWVHDVTNATLTNGCWAALPQDTYIYFKATPTFDPAGVNKGPTLSQYRMGYSSVANAFVITINNVPVLQIGENQIIATRPIVVPSVTVSGLPAATTANRGMEYYVTDANSTTRLATAVGGGANYVKVFSNGTNWLIQ